MTNSEPSAVLLSRQQGLFANFLIITRAVCLNTFLIGWPNAYWGIVNKYTLVHISDQLGPSSDGTQEPEEGTAWAETSTNMGLVAIL